MHVNNKKIENILLNVILFTLTETLAPKFAVNTLVDDTNKTIAKFRYPKEKGGKVQVDLSEYEQNLELLVGRLSKTGAKLIWRNTTPIPPGSKGRYVGDSIRYNSAASRVMIRYSIPTHDLFTLSRERMKDIMRPANVHYTEEGSKVLAESVADVILQALK